MPMTNLENIKEILNNKLAAKPEGVLVVSPQDLLSPQIQAGWLISLLVKMYVTHGITKNRDQVVADISSGKNRCWFAVENDRPVACAVQVAQSDGSVEIGRAVSVKPGTGSLVMLAAAVDHLQRQTTPLVAEVRVSDDFAGVPSGCATQAICFGHLGMQPHALVPAFNHGQPVRQEQFLFSSNTGTGSTEPVCLPDDPRALRLLFQTAVSLISGGFSSRLTVGGMPETFHRPHWEVDTRPPFSLLTAATGNSNLESALKKAEAHANFTLIPMETIPSNSSAIIECLNLGFVPCGFDRHPDISGRPVLLLGKLKTGTLLAPIKIAGDFLNPIQKNAIHNIDSAFRKSLKNC